MTIRIPKGKKIIWMRSCNPPNLESHVTLLWKMSKLLNLGSRPSPSLRWTHYLRIFIISGRDQLPFKNNTIYVRFESLHHYRWENRTRSPRRATVDVTVSQLRVLQPEAPVEGRRRCWLGLHQNHTVRNALRHL